MSVGIVSAATGRPAADSLISLKAFLSPADCASIREELAFSHWFPSGVSERDEEGHIVGRVSRFRTSESTDESWFTGQLARTVRRIDRRIETVLPGFCLRREVWQATRYFRGGLFKAHFDCGHWADEPAGDREHTVLIFLNAPRAGGETCFPRLCTAIRPAAGLFVAWRNLTSTGTCDPSMLHASLPVRAGRKMVLVTWLRQRAFERRTQ